MPMIQILGNRKAVAFTLVAVAAIVLAADAAYAQGSAFGPRATTPASISV